MKEFGVQKLAFPKFVFMTDASSVTAKIAVYDEGDR